MQLLRLYQGIENIINEQNIKVIWNPATGNYTVTSETAKTVARNPGAVSC